MDDYAEVQEYLQMIQDYEQEIDNERQEIQMLRAVATSISSTQGDGVRSGGAGDKTGSLVAQIIDKEKSVREKTKHLDTLKREVISIIDQIESPYGELLYKRYLEYKTWTRIAEELGCSDRKIYGKTGLHRQALARMQYARKKGLDAEQICDII